MTFSMAGIGGLLFLFVMCVIVGIFTLILTGAFVDALQGNISARAFASVVVSVTLLSVCTLWSLGITHVMLHSSVVITISAVALLLLPIHRRDTQLPPFSAIRRTISLSVACASCVAAFTIGLDWITLKTIGMSDALIPTPQGQVLRCFVDFCIGLSCGTILRLIWRIIDEGAVQKELGQSSSGHDTSSHPIQPKDGK